MMSNKKTRFLLLLLTVLGSIAMCFPLQAWAADKDADDENASKQIGFYISEVMPETQFDKDVTYYYIRVKPGEKQELKLQVISSAEDAVTVMPLIENAGTGQNGKMNYIESEVNRDQSMKHSLRDIVKLKDSSVTVKNYETKTITMTVDPPKEGFKGVVMGRVRVAEKKEKQEGLSNTYSYGIGIVLTEDGTYYNEGGELNFIRVLPKVNSGRRAMAVTFQNSDPYLLEGLTIKTTYTKKGSSTVLGSQESSGLRMAPNSNFEFVTYWGAQNIEAGDYTVHVTAKSAAKSWKWDEDFTVTGDQVAKINEEALFQLHFPKNYLIWLAILGVITVILLLVRMIVGNKKEKNKRKQPPKKKDGTKEATKGKTNARRKSGQGT